MSLLRRLAATAAALLLCASASVAGQTIKIVSDRVLPAAASRALDVRWASADSFYVSTMAAGVLRFRLDDLAQLPGASLAAEGKSCPTCSRLGVSDQFMVTAFPAVAMAWKKIGGEAVSPFPFDATLDLDVSGDRLLILGSRRDKSGAWAPDGAIVWTGSLAKGLADLHPVQFSSLGPEAQIMGRCAFLGNGAARFLSDGSFVVAPGVEPGVFLYDASGKLRHVWQTDALGFLDRC